jgi:hypothetical protein
LNDEDFRRLREQVRALPPQTLLAAAAVCDGHSIFKPQTFLDAGLPPPVVEHLTRRYRSDGTPKGTLFVNGVAVEELCGCYGLEVLRFLAHALDVPYRHALGRGFEAQNIRTALEQVLRPRCQPQVPESS